MADPKIRKIFKEAAEIAKGMPQGLQESAFNRALDVLLGNGRPNRAQDGAGDDNGEAEVRGRLLGIPGAGMLLDTSVAAFNLAANRLGISEIDADELADVIEDTLGPHVRQSVVGRAFEGSGNVVDTARSGASAVFRAFGGASNSDDDDDDDDEDAPKPRSAAKKGAARGKKSAAKKKSAPKKKPKADTKRTAARGVAGTVINLVTKGFFTSARTATQVVFYLNRKGIEITVRELTPILMRLIQDGLLSRSRGAGGEYVYEKA